MVSHRKINGLHDPAQDMPGRRHLLKGLSAFGGLAGLALLTPSPALAALRPTPRQSTGPFYPVRLPLDFDNNLIDVDGRPEPASGQIAHVFGRLRDDRGRAIRGAEIEIWQCDALGRYHHPRDRGGIADPNFQGFGRTITDAEGRFRFRTLKPVAYPGRAPHIHFAIKGPDFQTLTTQMYVAGEPLNQRDFLLNRIQDTKARQSLIVDLKSAPEVETETVAGTFEIVLGSGLFGF